MLAELRRSVPRTLSNLSSGGHDRQSRWENLLAFEKHLENLQTVATSFDKNQWPAILKRLRGRHWLESGGVLVGADSSSPKQVVVSAPITGPNSERRRGLIIALIPAGALWSMLDQSLLELARPVGLQVAWDYGPAHPYAWKSVLERSVDRIDPPLHIRLSEANAEEHNQFFARRRWIYGGMTGLSLLVIVVGLVLMEKAVRREVEVANLKADFVATVSHELRTPLAAISHIGERLSLGRYRSEVEQKEFYDLLGKETQRLRGLIEDILDFSKMLAGRKKYKREPLDAAELLQEAVESFEGKAEDRGFKVLLHLPDEKVMMEGDRSPLLHAILNLLDNAIKYSGESHKIDVRLLPAKNRCRIEIEDYGIGIPESEFERIFEKFYRVENAMTHTSESGVGLGLAMVKHVVEGHHGAIDVQSRVGQGSVFSMEFPLFRKV
jgi:signal transduction histidine kinase